MLPDEIGDLRSLHVLDIAGNRLHHLPVTLGLCSLKAIWLSENQTHPMLQFQEDVDEETGSKVLTCFLLPQLAYQTESMENLLRDSTRNIGVDQGSWDSSEPSRPQGSVGTTIVFSGVEENDADHEREESRFIRQNTPHPKELRTKYAGKLTKKECHQAVENVYYEFHEAQESSVIKQVEIIDNVMIQNPVTNLSSPTSIGSELMKSDDVEPTKSSKDPQVTFSKEVPSPHSPSLPQVQPSLESPLSNHLPSKSQPSISLSSPSLPHSASQLQEVTFSFEEVKNDNDFDTCADEKDEHKDDKEDLKQTDEEDGDEVVERHVGFAPDVDEFRSGEGKLRRRDTPHHLKNKRILSKTDPEEKLKRILAQATGGLQRLSSSDGSEWWSPDDSSVKFRATSDSSNDAENTHSPQLLLHSDDDADKSISDDELSNKGYEGDENSGMGYHKVENNGKIDDHCQKLEKIEGSAESVEMVLRIIRDQSLGLGMSIAGGLGSSPYRSQDKGIFVSRVVPGGPAQRAGIVAGDRLISVNGRNAVNVTHLHAVNLLGGAGEEVTVLVLRETIADNGVSQEDVINRPHNVAGAVVVTLTKDNPSSGFGFSLVENRNRVVTISKIMPGGIADQDGKLKTRDRIMTVNGTDLSCSGLKKVVSVLSECKCRATIVVFRNKSSSFSPTRDFQDTPISPTRLRLASLSSDYPISHSLEPSNVSSSPQNTATNVISTLSSSQDYNCFSPVDTFTYPDPAEPSPAEHVHAISAIISRPPSSTTCDGHLSSLDLDNSLETLKMSDINVDKNAMSLAERDVSTITPKTLDNFHLRKQPVSSESCQRFDFLATPSCFMLASSLVPLIPKPYVRPENQCNILTSSGKPPPQQDVTPAIISSETKEEISKSEASDSLAFYSSLKNAISDCYSYSSGIPICSSLRHGADKLLDCEKMAEDDSASLKCSNDHVSHPFKESRNVFSEKESNTMEDTFQNQDYDEQIPCHVLPPQIEGALIDLTHEASCAYGQNKTAAMDEKLLRSFPIEKVTLKREEGPLGLSIVGGSDHPGDVFASNVPGVSISGITMDGAASRSDLTVGDRIVSVNGVDVRQAKHSTVVELLQSSEGEVHLEVMRDPVLMGLQEVMLIREPGARLGISIRGGRKSKSGNPSDPKDEGIFISKIHPLGIAFRDGRLKVGHRILEVNGLSILGFTHQEAVDVLKSSMDNRMSMVVCNGFESRHPEEFISTCSSKSARADRFHDEEIRVDSISSLDWTCEPKSDDKTIKFCLSSVSPSLQQSRSYDDPKLEKGRRLKLQHMSRSVFQLKSSGNISISQNILKKVGEYIRQEELSEKREAFQKKFVSLCQSNAGHPRSTRVGHCHDPYSLALDLRHQARTPSGRPFAHKRIQLTKASTSNDNRVVSSVKSNLDQVRTST